MMGFLSAVVAGVFAAIAINPGYHRHWSFLVGDVFAVPIAVALPFLAARRVGASRTLSHVLSRLVVCAGIGLVFVVGFAQRPDRRADEAKNLHFLSSVHRYPGSIPTGTASHALAPSGDMLDEGFINPSPGYGTDLTFLLPSSVTVQQAVVFYRSEFQRHGWPVQEYAKDCSSVPPACGQTVVAHRRRRNVVAVLVYPLANGRITAIVERDAVRRLSS